MVLMVGTSSLVALLRRFVLVVAATLARRTGHGKRVPNPYTP